MELAIIAITRRGAELARRLGDDAGRGAVWLPEKFRADDGCNYFAVPLAEQLPRLFAACDGVVCIMATGIVVRLLAPHLQGKEKDAAVVVVDEAGEHAISLLSGHLGGANELASEVAGLIGARPVITTATDVNELPAWDDVARRLDLGVEPLSRIKLFNRLLLDGEAIDLVDRDGAVAACFTGVSGVQRFATFAAAGRNGSGGTVIVSNRHLPQLERQENLLALRPRNLVVGIGCNRGTSAAEIEQVVRTELQQAFLAFGSIVRLASIEAKSDEAGLLAFAGQHDLPLAFYAKEQLNAVAAPSPPSEHALAAVGASGVCEPAAILAAGGGALLVKKKKRGNVTVAVAELPSNQRAGSPQSHRGHRG